MIEDKLFRFVRWELREDKKRAVYKPLYRTMCTPDAEWQRGQLEKLRYKWGGYRHGTRVIQWTHTRGMQWALWLFYAYLFWTLRGRWL